MRFSIVVKKQKVFDSQFSDMWDMVLRTKYMFKNSVQMCDYKKKINQIEYTV